MAFKGLTAEVNKLEQTFQLDEVFGQDMANNESAKLKFGQLIIDRIVNRTSKDAHDSRDSSFAKGSYSDEYSESLDFQAASKSKNRVNLTQSGDMMASIDITKNQGNTLTISFDDPIEESKGANHEIGDTVPKRPWFGVSDSEAKDIASNITVPKTQTQTVKDILELLERFGPTTTTASRINERNILSALFPGTFGGPI